MGHGIALVAALSGYEVVLNDLKEELLEVAQGKINKYLISRAEKGKIREEDRRETLARIKTTINLAELKDCELIIEAIAEDRQLKKDLFQELDKICPPETIFASNTSTVSITELAKQRPDKFIGMHFMNPAPAMKLVEVVKGVKTSDETIAITIELAKKMGKIPIEINDSPGFVVNRLLIPMINEAVYCLMEKVANKEAIDEVMKIGANHSMGPLELADLIGLDICLNIMEELYQSFADDKYRPCPLLKKMVADGFLGKKSGQGFYKYN